MLSTLTLDHTFERSFWKELSFFALVKPEEDILPVRTVYDGRTQNIGLNYLSSSEPIWYAGPDIVASKLLRGKAPKILKAIRMLPHGQQTKLDPTNLGGMVEIKPFEDDFFVRVIEQRSLHKPTNKALADFLKVLANSGSYGLFVQVNPETLKKPKNIKVFSGTVSKTMSSLYVEKVGPWYFPPLAALITSGGRLLLAMLERCVEIARGSYLFCDTDSMCIVSTRNGTLIRCDGGKHKLNGKDGVKALSFKRVDSIAARFKRLNPYNPSLVKEILKIEDINHVDSDTKKPRRQLFGYAISAKRYALFTETEKDISIVKASGHGLGYLFAPKERKKAKDVEDEDEDEVPEWIMEAWDSLLRKELVLNARNPSWLRLPAMMRMGMTSPNVMRNNRPEWLAPFNFFLFPLLSDLGGYPAGFDKSNFKFITPAERDRRKWPRLRGLNLLDKFYRSYRIRMNPDGKQQDVVPESMRIILKQYLRHPEVKSLAPDGTPCQGDTVGLLRRAFIVAGEIVPVGKETDRHWEQGEDPSLIDFKVHEFRNAKRLVSAHTRDIARWKEKFGVREMMRKANLAQPTVYAILREEPVRPRTLAIFKQAMDG
jgi:hypothetical protein